MHFSLIYKEISNRRVAYVNVAGFGSGQKRSSETLTGQYRLFGVSVVTCTAFEDGKSDVTGLSSF